LNKSQIAKRYSKVIINKVDINDVPRVIEELKAFSKLVDMDKKFKILFASQIFSDDEKNRVLDEVLSYLKVSSHSVKFLKLIIAQGSLIAINDIIKAIFYIYEERIKKVTAEVTSPVKLDEGHVGRLKTAIRSLTSRDVEIESKLDPSLIGGFIVKVGSTVYDSSIKGQLQILKSELTR
jgi:ATP synthase F1 delta subunit